MNKENRQYLIVGLFVIITTTILVLFWLWFASVSRQKYSIYLAVFNEPVDGLSISSPVKYNGVDVGSVKKILLNEKNPRNILVYLNIIPSTPINKKTIASIKSQGVTGLSYIGLNLPANADLNDNITPRDTKPYPQILTKPSLLYSLSEQAQSVSNNIQDISGQMKLVLSNENIKQFSEMLKNLNKITETIANKSANISQSMTDMTEIISNIKISTQSLTTTIKNIDDLTKSIAETSNSTNKLINNVQDNTLSNINSVLLPNLNQSIANISNVSYQLEQFMNIMNQNPSALIRGVDNRKLGPGETK